MPIKPQLSETALLVAEIFDVFASLQDTRGMHLELNKDGSGSVTVSQFHYTTTLCSWSNPDDAIDAIASLE